MNLILEIHLADAKLHIGATPVLGAPGGKRQELFSAGNKFLWNRV
jgi:hypothetical protein